MPSQIPAFRRTVARQMEAYRQRFAERIKNERLRRGLQPRDVAYAIGTDKRTVERWESAETAPQLRNLKALADAWDMEIADLRPDLEAEERALQDQLDRIEAKVDTILEALTAREDDEAGLDLPQPPSPPSPEPSAPDEDEPSTDEGEQTPPAG